MSCGVYINNNLVMEPIQGCNPISERQHSLQTAPNEAFDPYFFSNKYGDS